MKIICFGNVEEYPVRFKLYGGSIVLDNPPGDLLVSLCAVSQLPIDGARLPRYPHAVGLLIATTSAPEIGDTYGENEYCVDVQYSPEELAEMSALYARL